MSPFLSIFSQCTIQSPLLLLPLNHHWMLLQMSTDRRATRRAAAFAHADGRRFEGLPLPAVLAPLGPAAPSSPRPYPPTYAPIHPRHQPGPRASWSRSGGGRRPPGLPTRGRAARARRRTRGRGGGHLRPAKEPSACGCLKREKREREREPSASGSNVWLRTRGPGQEQRLCVPWRAPPHAQARVGLAGGGAGQRRAAAPIGDPPGAAGGRGPGGGRVPRLAYRRRRAATPQEARARARPAATPAAGRGRRCAPRPPSRTSVRESGVMPAKYRSNAEYRLNTGQFPDEFRLPAQILISTCSITCCMVFRDYLGLEALPDDSDARTESGMEPELRRNIMTHGITCLMNATWRRCMDCRAIISPTKSGRQV
jgi:hypothetical protein